LIESSASWPLGVCQGETVTKELITYVRVRSRTWRWEISGRGVINSQSTVTHQEHPL
jgi:hypothetical protein